MHPGMRVSPVEGGIAPHFLGLKIYKVAQCTSTKRYKYSFLEIIKEYPRRHKEREDFNLLN
jgi:hypothetical protein